MMSRTELEMAGVKELKELKEGSGIGRDGWQRVYRRHCDGGDFGW